MFPRSTAAKSGLPADITKHHGFELSDSLENNSAGVVEVPDLGEYTDVTLRLYSPTIRFIEFRPSSVKGSAVPEGLKSMTLSLHNVIPSGEAGSSNPVLCDFLER